MSRIVHGKEVLTSLEEWIRPEHTAVIVVDVQNDFCSMGGDNHNRGRDMTPLQEMLPRLRKLIDGARAGGVRVIYIQHTVYPDGSTESPAYMAYRLNLNNGNYPTSLCIDGTWGHQVCDEVAPLPGEIRIRKHRQPPWVGTDLDQILRNNGIKTIVATGTMTSACVDWTARLGVQLDYYVVVPEDCVAQADIDGHNAAIANLRRYLPKGGVTDADTLVGLWSPVAVPA
jgi:ureidoacrylate peracid hydrolase